MSLARRTPLARGTSQLKRTPLARGTSQLKTKAPLKARTPIKRSNLRRKAKKAEQQFGPGGGGGVYASLMRARPCDTCGKGRRLPSQAMSKTDAGWVLDLERLELSQQSEFSHVIALGAGGVKGRWWDGISQCRDCHRLAADAVHRAGWGACHGLALLLAHSIAWAAADQGLVPPPDCERPGLPSWAEAGSEVAHYQGLLRAAWPSRLDTEDTNA